MNDCLSIRLDVMIPEAKAAMMQHIALREKEIADEISRQIDLVTSKRIEFLVKAEFSRQLELALCDEIERRVKTSIDTIVKDLLKPNKDGDK